MAQLRLNALGDVLLRKPKHMVESQERVSDYFGRNTFHIKVMREFLSDAAYKSVKSAIQNGTSVSREIADQVATSMKDWAITKGATHYTHWFQPLTGATAEKHDGLSTIKFLALNVSNLLNDDIEYQLLAL